ncbi:hypothetical protein [Oscillibacter sp.]|uniref:hypothetical protein n=1 Tax=Oscillibacter sp. TaxID=1945593 RepID=UPI00257A3240|nr:hypothetical protein [Oscillibacter sp.]
MSIKLEHDCERAGRPCPNARAMYDAFVRNGNWEGCCGCCAMCLKRDTCDLLPVCGAEGAGASRRA